MNSHLKTMRKLVGSCRLLLPGIRAIIPNEDGEILLQRRTDMPVWALRAGSVELDETALEGLQREVQEETALKVLEAEPTALCSESRQPLIYPDGDKIRCFSVAFIVRQWEGHPKNDGKIDTRMIGEVIKWQIPTKHKSHGQFSNLITKNSLTGS